MFRLKSVIHSPFFLHSSLTKVKQACEGKPSCTLSASNGVFGDPCRGTYKYLDVKYVCRGAKVPGPAKRPRKYFTGI